MHTPINRLLGDPIRDDPGGGGVAALLVFDVVGLC